MSNRRQVITALAAASLAAPGLSWAQTAPTRIVGIEQA